MEEQLFLNFNLNFNLRNQKCEKPSLIYSVVTWQGKQLKVSTGMKVFPDQWDKKKQLCKVGTGLSKLDNRNNTIANNKIKDTLFAFSELKLFLCEQDEFNYEDFNTILRKYLNPTLKTKKLITKNMENATITISRHIDKGSQSEQSKKIYHGNINTFKKFLNVSGIQDTWANINKDTIEKYKQWCIDKHEVWNTTNNKIDFIKNILKEIDEINGIWDYNKSKIDKIKRIPCKLSNKEQHELQLALNEKEIITLYRLNQLSEEETEIRDIFILQTLVGQRIGDMHKVFDGSIAINENATITITQQKTKESATIPIFPLTQELLQKYQQGFRYIDTNLKKDQDKINTAIKKIAAQAGLTTLQTYVQQYGYDRKNISKRMCDRIHTHTARHSFITMMCLCNVPKEDVIIATGHTDTKMIDKVYLHLQDADKRNKVSKSFANLDSSIFGGYNSDCISEKQNNNPPTSLSSNSEIGAIKELAKENVILEQNNKKVQEKLNSILNINEIVKQHDEYTTERLQEFIEYGSLSGFEDNDIDDDLDIDISDNSLK